MNKQLPTVVRVTVLLTVAFWLFMFLRQIFTIWRTVTIDIDPLLQSFAYRFAITSSALLFAYIASAALLTAFVWTRRSRWAAVGLCFLFAAAVWQYLLAGTSILFQPPLGDGSFSGALSAQRRITGSFFGLHVVQSILLVTLLLLWLLCLSRLHALNRNA